MTKLLRLTLFGAATLELDGKPLTGLPSRTAEALLIYLACQQRPFTREALAELLWAERSPQQALTNLRTILSALRRELGEHLLIQRDTLAFNREADFWLDADGFERGLAKLAPAIQSVTPLDDSTAGELQAILALYQGDFLSGFALRDGPGFEEWLSLEQERLRRLAHSGFRRLARHFLEIGDYPSGIRSAYRWMGLDAYDEEACRTLMWLLARAGQRNAALQHYQELKRRLAEDLDVAPAQATTALFQRLKGMEIPPPNNLPAEATTFIGRVSELADLERHISASNPRLVTLVGPGGIGKTRLSIQLARSLIQRKPGRFLDGAFFVPLSAVDSPEALPTRIAEAVGLAFQGSASPRQELLAHLQEREILLILDNFEHLMDENGGGVDLLDEILQHASQVKLLVTSRERLNLYEELVFDLAGLDVPPSEVELPEGFSAVALFLQSARRANSQFTPAAEELAWIGRACRLVEGIPLAVELAAGWTRHYTCREIVQQIEISLDFLRSSLRNLPERHRSLRAVFDHSWNLLSSAHQEIFAGLSIFEGGFTFAAAKLVLPGQPDEATVLALVEKSLIQPQVGERYNIHPLLRQYAAEKLYQHAHLHAEVAQRQAAYYLDYVAGQPSGESVAERTVLRQEIGNIQTAWQWAAQQHDAALLESAAPILHNFYSIQSWFQEGIRSFRWACEQFAGETAITPAQAALLCNLYGRKARLCIHIGRIEEARADLQTALTYLAAVEDPERRSTVYGYLAITSFYAGDYQQAAELADESRRIAEQINDQDGISFAWNFMGSCAKALGNYEQARQFFTHSVAIYRALADDIGAAMVINNLGNLAQVIGDYEAAQAYYQECGQLFKAHDHLHGAATTLTNAGKLALRLGKLAEADQLLQEGLAMKRQIGDQRGVAIALIALGDVSVTRDELPRAQEQLAQGLQLALESGDVSLLLDGLAVAADWLCRRGQSEVATALMAYIQDHKAASQETRERVNQAIAGVQSQPATTPKGFSMWVKDDSPEAVTAKLLPVYFNV